jgi:hypothetical protein
METTIEINCEIVELLTVAGISAEEHNGAVRVERDSMCAAYAKLDEQAAYDQTLKFIKRQVAVELGEGYHVSWSSKCDDFLYIGVYD